MVNAVNAHSTSYARETGADVVHSEVNDAKRDAKEIFGNYETAQKNYKEAIKSKDPLRMFEAQEESRQAQASMEAFMKMAEEKFQMLMQLIRSFKLSG